MSRSRALTDTVQINLRLKESERLRLVAAAQQAGAPTFNGFIVGLLKNALEQGCPAPQERRCPMVQAIENGIIKRVEFVFDKSQEVG